MGKQMAIENIETGDRPDAHEASILTYAPRGGQTADDACTAGTEDQDRVVDVIVLAFVSDPFARWLYPEPHRYLKHAGDLTRAFGCSAFAHHSVHHVAGFSGAALWLPPGVAPEEEMLLGIIRDSIEPHRLQTVLSIFEQMEKYHPAEPHWYLPLIGVDPPRQGRGYGAALLRHALNRIDQELKPAYLENTNPANTPLYERHGFKAVGRIQLADAPPLIPMLRLPR